MDYTNEIEKIVIALADNCDVEAKENNSEKLDELRKRYSENEDLYDAETAVSIDNLATILAAPFLESHGVTDRRRRNIACYLYGQQIPHFLDRTIRNREGMPCSADKKYFIIRRLKKYIITGENQSLYAEYKDRPERAYWSPRSFKDTDEVLDAFFKWYNVDE